MKETAFGWFGWPVSSLVGTSEPASRQRTSQTRRERMCTWGRGGEAQIQRDMHRLISMASHTHARVFILQTLTPLECEDTMMQSLGVKIKA